jgi:uncharacterized membrane protein YheB (UPF0754 family)
MQFRVSLSGLMQYYIIILTVSVITGCIAGLLLRMAVIRRLPQLKQNFSQTLPDDLFSEGSLRASIAQKNDFENIRPLVEEHINEFLQNRLGKEMPMIGMFIGDKTIAQLKTIFMKELEEIFPLVMDKYVSNLSPGNVPEQLISGRIPHIPTQKLQFTLNHSARRELIFIPVFTTLTGLAIGILQLIIISVLA